MAMRLILRGVAGVLKAQEFVFTEHGPVGRSRDCSLRLPDETVSRHCRLDLDTQGASVQDLGSLNGTFVNGQLVGRCLVDGVENRSRCTPPGREN
jgi:predicted component of type VI protein secretion system